jgi:hypothetical protein
MDTVMWDFALESFCQKQDVLPPRMRSLWPSIVIWTVSKLLKGERFSANPSNYLLTVQIIIVSHGSLEHFCTMLLIYDLKQ